MLLHNSRGCENTHFALTGKLIILRSLHFYRSICSAQKFQTFKWKIIIYKNKIKKCETENIFSEFSVKINTFLKVTSSNGTIPLQVT